MATLQPVHAASFDSLESRKRKLDRVPLPYLIRPCKKQPVYDPYALYNDFIAYSALEDGFGSESDDEDSSVMAVRTSLEKASLSETVSAGSLSEDSSVMAVRTSLEKVSLSETVSAGLMTDNSSVMAVRTSLEKVSLSDIVSVGSLSDEEYVVVDNGEVLPNSKTERAGAIQMMELSKDAAVDESESKDAGSDSDAWVVV